MIEFSGMNISKNSDQYKRGSLNREAVELATATLISSINARYFNACGPVGLIRAQAEIAQVCAEITASTQRGRAALDDLFSGVKHEMHINEVLECAPLSVRAQMFAYLNNV